MKRKQIYLDNAATTRVDERVVEKMLPYFCDIYGNPSSAHEFGHVALSAVDDARWIVSRFFNCEIDEMIFTSGATEANNLFLQGMTLSALRQGVKNPKIITSCIEHPSVMEVMRVLEKKGVCVEYLGVDRGGVVDLEDVKRLIDENTVIVSVMYANNEIGSIQPIREIGKIVKKFNDRREKDWRQTNMKNRGGRPRPILMHTDATQAVQYLNCDIKWNYLDAVSVSGHKAYGPKGVGVLMCRDSMHLEPMMYGGGQEMGKRSGTMNVSGIVGLGVALDLICDNNDAGCVLELKELLIRRLVKVVGVSLNVSSVNCLPNIVSFKVDGVEAESLMIALDMEGVAVSTGSACATEKTGGSYVLGAIGLSKKEMMSSLRVSLGRFSTREEIDEFVVILSKVVKKMKLVR